MTKQTEQPVVREGRWPTRTFTCGEVTVTVERATWGHSEMIARIKSMLPKRLIAVPVLDENRKPKLDDRGKPQVTSIQDGAEYMHHDLFARMCAQSIQVEGLALALPDSGAGEKEVLAAYQAVQRMDEELLNIWYEAIQGVNQPSGDKTLWPSHKLTEIELKKWESVGQNGRADSGATSTAL